MEGTTIKISWDVKEEIEKIKIHPREPYNDVIKRLIDNFKNK